MFWDGHIKEWNELPRAKCDLNAIDKEGITNWMLQKFLHENVGSAKKHKKEQGQVPSVNLNNTPQGKRHCWNFTTLVLRAIESCWTENTRSCIACMSFQLWLHKIKQKFMHQKEFGYRN